MPTFSPKAGLTPCRLHPKQRIYTFWKYWRNSFERDAGLRIDHLLVSPELAPWLRKADVRRSPRGWDHTSDHARS